MNFKEYLNEAREFDIIIDQLDENAGVAAAAASALAQVGGPSSLSTADAATGAALLTIATGILVLGTSATVNAFFDDWFTHPIKNLKKLLANRKAKAKLQKMLSGFMERHQDNQEVKDLAVAYVKAKSGKRKQIATDLQQLIPNDPIIKQRTDFLKAIREMGAE